MVILIAAGEPAFEFSAEELREFACRQTLATSWTQRQHLHAFHHCDLVQTGSADVIALLGIPAQTHGGLAVMDRGAAGVALAVGWDSRLHVLILARRVRQIPSERNYTSPVGL